MLVVHSRRVFMWFAPLYLLNVRYLLALCCAKAITLHKKYVQGDEHDDISKHPVAAGLSREKRGKPDWNMVAPR